MAKMKLIVSLVLGFLLLVVILQNIDEVETQILFMTITMPRAVLLLLSAGIGFLLGVITTFRIAHEKKGKNE